MPNEGTELYQSLVNSIMLEEDKNILIDKATKLYKHQNKLITRLADILISIGEKQLEDESR